MEEKKILPLAQKLFYNEHGEISLTKLGVVFSGIGGMLIANPLPPAEVFFMIGTYTATIGGICTALGLLSKKGRTK